MNKFCNPYSEDDMKKDGSEITRNDLDTLTQIATRQKFDVVFKKALARSKTTVCYLTILMIEIDYFEYLSRINGQLSGEDCLRLVASTLKDTLKRSGDLAARWDDKIFACILSDTDPAGASEMAEKIRTKVLSSAIPHPASPVAEIVTVSIGGVTAILTDETAYDTLLKKADQALLKAIEAGRNRIFISES